MVRSRVTLLAAIAVAMLAADAYAAKVSIGGKHPRSEIRAACDANGGDWRANLSGYGCFKADCDGSGGMCAVTCQNNGQCTGHTPRKSGTAPATVNSILNN